MKSIIFTFLFFLQINDLENNCDIVKEENINEKDNTLEKVVGNEKKNVKIYNLKKRFKLLKQKEQK